MNEFLALFRVFNLTLLLGRLFPRYNSRGRQSLGPGNAFTLMEVTTTQGRVRPCQRHQE